ncbi:hypothetical protein OXX79_002144 [Metschnikowia pulcherrima]
MAPSFLENDLDEFNVRYWESCQEVMTKETCSGKLISRLSSPLPVLESSKSSKSSQNWDSGKPAGKSMDSVADVVEESESSHAVAEKPNTLGNKVHDTLHGSDIGVEGHEEQTNRDFTSFDGRSGPKLKATRPKLSPKFPKRQSLGNPFYRRGSAGKKSPVALSHQ